MSKLVVKPPSGCGPLATEVADPKSPLRQQLFERVRAAGTIARVDVARDLDISPATVTALTGELIDQGLICEYEPQREASRGRPRMAIGVVPLAHLVIGMKLGDKTHTAVLTDFAGTVLASVALDRETPFDSLGDLLDLIEEIVDLVCAEGRAERNSISAVGIGIPGFVEYKLGVVHWSPLIAEREVDLVRAVSDRLGLATALDNDANVATLAELWFGTGRAEKDFAVVTIEHGVGMGVVINHQLYRGAKGLGLELGHTKVQIEGALCRCGQRGCLEAYLADYALAREATTALGRAPKTPGDHAQIVADLYTEALQGHAGAQSIFRRSTRYLALGLANIANLFDPGRIILSAARPHFDFLYASDVLADVQDMIVNRSKPMPDIEVRDWGGLIWARGAAALALDHLCNDVLTDRKEAQSA